MNNDNKQLLNILSLTINYTPLTMAISLNRLIRS